MRFNSFIALAVAAAQSAAGLGINCHGDTLCGIAYMSGGRLSQFGDIFENIMDKRNYDNGDDVGCIEVDSVNFSGSFKSTFCAYIQNSQDSVTGAALKSLYKELVDYGCAICGSVPLLYGKGDDDINHGELTINMVDSLPDGCKINVPCSSR
ncbi:killer toxin [Trichoderma ceciliae]